MSESAGPFILRSGRGDFPTPRAAIALAEKAMLKGRVHDAERLLYLAHQILAEELTLLPMLDSEYTLAKIALPENAEMCPAL
jgi:hypothetical protein